MNFTRRQTVAGMKTEIDGKYGFPPRKIIVKDSLDEFVDDFPRVTPEAAVASLGNCADR
jgi:hypothetical protein